MKKTKKSNSKMQVIKKIIPGDKKAVKIIKNKLVEVIAIRKYLLRDMRVVLAGDTFQVDENYAKLLKDKKIIQIN